MQRKGRLFLVISTRKESQLAMREDHLSLTAILIAHGVKLKLWTQEEPRAVAFHVEGLHGAPPEEPVMPQRSRPLGPLGTSRDLRTGRTLRGLAPGVEDRRHLRLGFFAQDPSPCCGAVNGTTG